MCCILQTGGVLASGTLHSSQTEISQEQHVPATGQKQRLQFGPPLPVSQQPSNPTQQVSGSSEADRQQNGSTASIGTADQTPLVQNRQETESHLSAFAHNNPEGIRVSF